MRITRNRADASVKPAGSSRPRSPRLILTEPRQTNLIAPSPPDQIGTTPETRPTTKNPPKLITAAHAPLLSPAEELPNSSPPLHTQGADESPNPRILASRPSTCEHMRGSLTMTTPNFATRTLYHGDNLPFLRGINSGTIHLIATDPPFNKGRDFHATPDSLAAGARFEDKAEAHLRTARPTAQPRTARRHRPEESGTPCAGCSREFDEPLYPQLDHKTPRSEGGLNHISNRMLLCGPRNRIKSDRLPLNGLRAENRKRGRMARMDNRI